MPAAAAAEREIRSWALGAGLHTARCQHPGSHRRLPTPPAGCEYAQGGAHEASLPGKPWGQRPSGEVLRLRGEQGACGRSRVIPAARPGAGDRGGSFATPTRGCSGSSSAFVVRTQPGGARGRGAPHAARHGSRRRHADRRCPPRRRASSHRRGAAPQATPSQRMVPP